jgi:quercetin dioxygenase-like cupin family protein
VTLRVRRVVTGHDSERRAIVISDQNLGITTRRPGQEGCVVWATERIPADNLGQVEEAQKTVGTTVPDGAVFRVLRYEPGTAGSMHRTDSVDYGVVLNGRIVLQLDGGAEVTLETGDVLVQRGTAHSWINRDDAPCTIAFVLLAALPISAS